MNEKEKEEKPVSSTSVVFKKRKRGAGGNLRRPSSLAATEDGDSNADNEDANAEEDEADKADKHVGVSARKKSAVDRMKEKVAQKTERLSAQLDLGAVESTGAVATANVDHHVTVAVSTPVKKHPSGIKWKGPMKESANVRVISRIDYQPDICKDYKETGYCGFGDNCKFMHDRGDYKSGDQLEREWQEEQARRQKLLLGGDLEPEENFEVDPNEDMPWACLICRREFTRPVKTKCSHYYCESCALQHYAKSSKCFVCHKQTDGVFNTAADLIAVLAARKAKGWQPPVPEEEEEQQEVAPAAAGNVAEQQQIIELSEILHPKREHSMGWAYPNASAGK